MTENCFDVLGIAPTKDKTIIKKAYRALLRSVNPEDDTAGFQRLRAAYEAACRHADSREDRRKMSASEQFMERCQEVYAVFSRRICPEEWEDLFAEPVCLHLDTEEEVRRAFLTFLMDHFHFPTEVWQCIDRAFGISRDRKTLVEWFPEDFVDYLQQAVREEELLNYRLFEENTEEAGAKSSWTEQIDRYIDVYYRLRQFTDLGLMEQAAAEWEALSRLPVYHPYGEMERARILLYGGQKEEAGEIFLRLGKRYPLEERIACCCGQFLQMEGRWEEVRGIYDDLLARYPDSAAARNGKAEEMLHDGAYREAREIILDLLESHPQEERLLKDLTDANVFMIEELEAKREAGTLSQEDRLDLGWCYYQNLRFTDALALLDAFAPQEDDVLDYHNLKGRVYLTLERNEEALPHLQTWLAEIHKLQPDGTKKTKRRLARLGYAYYTIGSARAALLLQEENPEEAAFAETMDYFTKAIAEEKEEGQIVSYYHTMADIWKKRKEYGKVVDACDQMLLYNPGYYPAILLRQEACLSLGMYQEVADDYQRAVHMYPYYGRPYATLIQMYFLFGEYEKGKEILDIAQKNKVQSDSLQILTARYRAVTASRKEDLEEALQILQALQEKGWEISSDVEKEEWSEVVYYRGWILMDLGRLPEAIVCLQQALEDRPDEESILYRLGWCLKLEGRYREALPYMEKVLSLQPEHPGVRHVIAEIYERLAREEEKNAFYQMALPYMEEQVARYPEEYFLIEMGLLYLDMDRYEEALSYFARARKENPNSVYACNNAGNCYLSMNQPEKAESFFLEAVRLMKNEITPLPYNNLAKCYRMLGEYEKALFCYKKNRELFPDSLDIYLLLGDCYREKEEYRKAIAVYEEGMSKAKDPAPLEMELFRTYGMKGDYARASSLFHRLERKYPDDAVLFQLAGEVYLFGFEQGRQAAGYLREALRLSKGEDLECIRGSLYLLGRCQLFLGDGKEAKRYFGQYLDACRGKERRSRQYEEFYGERGRRKFRIGCVYFFLGDYAEAEKCFRDMGTDRYRCDGCARTCCYESLLAASMMLWAKGEMVSAIQKYKEAAQNVPDDMEHRFEIKCLQAYYEE